MSIAIILRPHENDPCAAITLQCCLPQHHYGEIQCQAREKLRTIKSHKLAFLIIPTSRENSDSRQIACNGISKRAPILSSTNSHGHDLSCLFHFVNFSQTIATENVIEE